MNKKVKKKNMHHLFHILIKNNWRALDQPLTIIFLYSIENNVFWLSCGQN